MNIIKNQHRKLRFLELIPTHPPIFSDDRCSLKASLSHEHHEISVEQLLLSSDRNLACHIAIEAVRSSSADHPICIFAVSVIIHIEISITC